MILDCRFAGADGNAFQIDDSRLPIGGADDDGRRLTANGLQPSDRMRAKLFGAASREL